MAGDEPIEPARVARKTTKKTTAKSAVKKTTATAKKTAAKKTTSRKSTAAKAAASAAAESAAAPEVSGAAADAAATESTAAPRKRATKKTTSKRTTTRKKTAASTGPTESTAESRPAELAGPAESAPVAPFALTPPPPAPAAIAPSTQSAPSIPSVPLFAPPSLFQPPVAPEPRRTRSGGRSATKPEAVEPDAVEPEAAAGPEVSEPSDAAESEGHKRRRRGRRGGKGRARSEDEQTDTATTTTAPAAAVEEKAADAEADEGEGDGSHRRRRRRRRGSDGHDDAPPAVDDGVRSVVGSVRLEARRQRRKESLRESRRRVPIISEAEFLARRESVERVMVVRESAKMTQIAVLEDDILVEHYVARGSGESMVGNVFLGRVQNVLPSMEAAFVEIGRGRNGVLYAGEVNYDASELAGKPMRIEQALKSGQSVMVQVTKDPIGHKGARLTSQISLPGRYLVLVPEGRRSGISRKLPDTERRRLKAILKKITPPEAGVIVRTAAEGASEEDLTRDIERLHAQWEKLKAKADNPRASVPSLLHGDSDLVVRVVRDLFNEDFSSLIVQGDGAYDTVAGYVGDIAPDLADRVSRWTEPGDVFAAKRIDEQLAKALDRKVWLPSGGYLIIDRTEAMVVIDVNTGRFTGSGGNLEETVTRNNLEAAEEIVRQMRLRDLGGMIVVDFVDMILESNRDLVLRRLTECLGRDRTKHQVTEVTSLGLVQMTRKRVGEGLAAVFGHVCSECDGQGYVYTIDPFEAPEPVTRIPTVVDTPEVVSAMAAVAKATHKPELDDQPGSQSQGLASADAGVPVLAAAGSAAGTASPLNGPEDADAVTPAPTRRRRGGRSARRPAGAPDVSSEPRAVTVEP